MITKTQTIFIIFFSGILYGCAGLTQDNGQCECECKANCIGDSLTKIMDK